MIFDETILTGSIAFFYPHWSHIYCKATRRFSESAETIYPALIKNFLRWSALYNVIVKRLTFTKVFFANYLDARCF